MRLSTKFEFLYNKALLLLLIMKKMIYLNSKTCLSERNPTLKATIQRNTFQAPVLYYICAKRSPDGLR